MKNAVNHKVNALYLGHQFTCDFKNSSFFLSQLVIYYFFKFFPRIFTKFIKNFLDILAFRVRKIDFSLLRWELRPKKIIPFDSMSKITQKNAIMRSEKIFRQRHANFNDVFHDFLCLNNEKVHFFNVDGV